MFSKYITSAAFILLTASAVPAGYAVTTRIAGASTSPAESVKNASPNLLGFFSNQRGTPVAGSNVAPDGSTPCIVTVLGQRYDVASLRMKHDGGDIFVCGTDMTTAYQGEHGTNVERIEPYRLLPASDIPSPAPVSVTPPSSAVALPLSLAPPSSGAAVSTRADPVSHRCLVTVAGKRYDVTSLQTTHGGGNVFICGTDMTSTYQKQHGTSVARIAPFMIASASAPTAAGAPATPSPQTPPPPNATTTPAVAPAAPTAPAGTSSGRCIVTVSGKQYDVTALRSTHGGGDIFRCGTDMSSTYQGQHGTSVRRLAPYVIGANGTAVGGPSVGEGDDGDEDDEDEDDEHDEDDD